jgi:hypothetical protein
MEELEDYLLNAYDSGQNIFILVNDIFRRALIIDPINGPNKIFFCVTRLRTISLNVVKKMIELGANPHYNNADPFIYLCSNKTVDVPLYFIDEHNIDPNVQDGMAAAYSTPNVLKMLLANGLKITN